MPVLSDTAIAQLAANAGFPNVALMTAIALAESGGDTNAVGNGAYGIWQIQTFPNDNDPTRSAIANTNPVTNAANAKKIFDQQGLSAWSAYTNGSYLKFVSRGQKAAQQVTPGGSVDIGNGTTATPVVSGVFGPLGTVFDTLTNGYTYKRIFFFGIGVWAILAGLVVVIRSTRTVKEVGNVAKKVAIGVATKGKV